jgi:hypothetical protein
MLITPPGTSEVSITWYRSVALKGAVSDGITITRLPIAIAGITDETNPNKGECLEQTIPITPSASGMASVTLRDVV